MFTFCCAGTTQQKELYPAQESEALTGSWLSRNSDAHLHAYRLSFDVQPVEDEVHADFVLLTGNALDDDVATLGTDLLLTRGRKVTAKLSPLGITTVTAHRVRWWFITSLASKNESVIRILPPNLSFI